MQDPLPGHQGHQIVIAAPPRTDVKVYSGIATFTASIPVEVGVLHNYTSTNSTSSSTINQSIGDLLLEGKPFTVTYTIDEKSIH
jgi:hypothetical protein